MRDVTQILEKIAAGDLQAEAELLPMVYDALRRLAQQKMNQESPGQTLQATGLVHEAYLRLVKPEDDIPRWENRGHFYAAAAEAMRRILVENARRKKRLKRGGDRHQEELGEIPVIETELREDLLALDEALQKLEQVDQVAHQLVQLRYFAGLTNAEAAEMLGIAARTADRHWAYARAWLHQELEGDQAD